MSDRKPVRVVEAQWTRWAPAPLPEVWRDWHLVSWVLPLTLPVLVHHFHWAILVGMGVGPAYMLIRGAIDRRRLERIVRAHYRPPNREAGELGLVAMQVYHGTLAYATDVGMLALGDGEIVFEGSQIAFVLDATRWKVPYAFRDPDARLLLVTSDDWPDRVVTFAPLPKAARRNRDVVLVKDLPKILREVRAATLAPKLDAPEVVVTPPCAEARPGPLGRVNRVIWTFVMTYTGALAGLILSYSSWTWMRWAYLASLAAVLALALNCLHRNRLADRAWRRELDRRRDDR